ncbi:MAG: aspartate aminotransferase family protein [Legionellaceae bacterium]|nr:aspartate aminotransferase family protein [Legionellaceae bacterium]
MLETMDETATASSFLITQKQLDSYWMPFTGNRQFKQHPRLISRAKDNYYYDTEGRKIFDGLSGLWTCGAGHCHPDIMKAMENQLKELDYSPSFQYGHYKAFQLAEKITEFMPESLNRVFFTGSGSESVDTALKIARAYWHKKGQANKTRFIGRIKGYHGVNFGGIGVGGISANKTLYGQSIDAIHLPHTMTSDNKFSVGQPQANPDAANQLEELFLSYDANTIAAVIVEPLSGSGGVIPPPKGYLKRLREICDKHDVLLIFDEVITAFGRMGAKTGAEAFGVTPDIMTIAKQLTNGASPMGAVVAKQEIYDTFMASGGPEYMLELPHGYTYSAHPLSCATALATLEVIENSHMIEHVKTHASQFAERLHTLKNSPYVTDIRNYGFAGGLTLEAAPGEPALRPYQVAMKCWEKGFYVRYGADTLQLGLPFTTNLSEMDAIINAIGDSLYELK